MGAMETMMIDASYAQVGKYLRLPTHTYLGASDAKVVDAQAGLESGMSALVAGLAGINMVSGAGMLDFLACQSAEKLVVDAEAIAMVQRLLGGVQVHSSTLATEFFEGINFLGEFLKQKATRNLFKIEQYMPSPVIDRETLRGWQQSGRQDTFQRARTRVEDLLAAYRQPLQDEKLRDELVTMVGSLAHQSGQDYLPGV